MSEQNHDDEGFAFINEKIKRKPLDKKRIAIHAVFTVVFAALFGLVACVVFVGVKPYVEDWLNPDSAITIPKDEQETGDSDELEDPEASTEEAEDSQEADSEPSVVYETKELEITDYQKLQNMIYDVGKEANKFVVTVTGLSSVTDWFDTSYETEGQASGILIADTGSELLILTERKVIADVQEIRITFVDDTSASAQIKKYDGNTGIAILSVDEADVSEDTMNAITTATLGNSLTVNQGQVVIAVGSPLGTNYSILTGNITSTGNEISTLDRTYSLFTTDIIGSSNGSGALINLSGEIVGLVMQGYSNSDDEGTLTAISISELKSIIEQLSNGQDIPYLGLKVSTVTDEIASDYEIPQGVYVKSIADDSPAMEAGLQSGDVIVKMGDTEIATIENYESVLETAEINSPLVITVMRQGTDGYTQIECIANVGVLQ